MSNSDLSVLKVQQALRKHAEVGHDVTQHPHEVHFDGKTYRMRVGSMLLMDEDDTYSVMRTGLTLSERPLLSVFMSRIGGQTTLHQLAPSASSLEVYPYFPHMQKNKSMFIDGSDALYGFPPHLPIQLQRMSHVKTSNKRPRRENSNGAGEDVDIHDTIQKHISHPLSRIGTESQEPFDRHSSPSIGADRYIEKLSDFKEPFNIQEALRGFHQDPYKGIVHVYHFGSRRRETLRGRSYSYEPTTEKLTPDE